MKESAKRLVSAVAAVVSAMSMAVSVYAADYGSEPSYSDTPSESVSVSTPMLSNAVSSAAASEAIRDAVENAVSDAVSNADAESGTSDSGAAVAAVEVKSTKKLKIAPSVMKELAASGDTVLKIESSKATIEIDASTIEKVKNVDLSMDIVNSKTKTVINIKSKKDFGCKIKITVTTCKLSLEKLAKAHVYCNGKDLGSVKIDADGNPVITVTKGGEYIIK